LLYHSLKVRSMTYNFFSTSQLSTNFYYVWSSSRAGILKAIVT
jgi:hypothetical protein